MAIWKKAELKKTIDWEEMAKDMRADINGVSFKYRATTFFK